MPVFGQVADLGCMRDEAGYSGDPLAHQECLGSVRLTRPGMYSLIVEYDGPDLSRPERSTVADDSATVARTGRGTGALRMADTATLVVTAGGNENQERDP